MPGPISKKTPIISIKALERIKEKLIDEGLLDDFAIQEMQEQADKSREPFTLTLVKSGIVSSDKLAQIIGDNERIPHVNIKKYTIDRSVLELVPERVARRHLVIPLFRIENDLTVAMADPNDIVALDELRSLCGNLKVEPAIASPESILQAIDEWYGTGQSRKNLIEELIEDYKEWGPEPSEVVDKSRVLAEVHLRMEADETPVVRLVASYIIQAMLEGASDIHLEPKRDYMAVRFRIDGTLYPRYEIPNKLVSLVIARIKIVSGLDISKTRIPQDGRVSVVIRDKKIDLRTSVFPTMHGENVVLRLLDRSKGAPTMQELGLTESDLTTMRSLLRASKGCVLVTGPTGSGKTTTLYSAINFLNTKSRNIMTVEDPIEYEVEGIVQSQINAAHGATFSNALRAILRQDPDIIYVGEVRDNETAEICMRAALTGHLVLSTLHTNDAIGVVTRLLDIGVAPDLLASVLNGCIAQRLVRRNCPNCTVDYRPELKLLRKLKIPENTVMKRGKGCDFCSKIGYRGRIGIYEILTMNNEIRTLLSKTATL